MPDLSIDIFNPGRDVTARATAPVSRSRLVKVSAGVDAGVPSVALADPGGRVFGVAKYDAAAGELVGVARGASRVVLIETGSALTAFEEVEVGADGVAVALDTGVAVGYAIDAATPGTAAKISLYA